MEACSGAASSGSTEAASSSEPQPVPPAHAVAGLPPSVVEFGARAPGPVLPPHNPSRNCVSCGGATSVEPSEDASSSTERQNNTFKKSANQVMRAGSSSSPLKSSSSRSSSSRSRNEEVKFEQVKFESANVIDPAPFEWTPGRTAALAERVPGPASNSLRSSCSNTSSPSVETRRAFSAGGQDSSSEITATVSVMAAITAKLLRIEQTGQLGKLGS